MFKKAVGIYLDAVADHTFRNKQIKSKIGRLIYLSFKKSKNGKSTMTLIEKFEKLANEIHVLFQSK